eukprot:TRINITY_DN6367_c0_g1_i3.p1 TRINITY_DN6367_c0_g1~~TRINITY_DN6367_c0_g1_i3.p1  ORF type:complete len:374 (+),score=37.14 TRINITY_DN6367_c0_g1_i3:582-1703(+)
MHLAPDSHQEMLGVQLGLRFSRAVSAIVETCRPLWTRIRHPRETIVPYEAVVLRFHPAAQARLSTHRDDCDVTLNICLQDCKKGGHLKFFLPEANWSVTHRHQTGVAVAHRGDVLHGTAPMREGERIQLVVKFRMVVPPIFRSWYDTSIGQGFLTCLSAHIQEEILTWTGSLACSRFACTSAKARATVNQQLWRRLYACDQALCELVSMEQLCSPPPAPPEWIDSDSDLDSSGSNHGGWGGRRDRHRVRFGEWPESDDEDTMELKLARLNQIGYRLEYIREIRLIDEDWRNAFRVVQGVLLVVQLLCEHEASESPIKRKSRMFDERRRRGQRTGSRPRRPTHGTGERWRRETSMFNDESADEYDSSDEDNCGV